MNLSNLSDQCLFCSMQVEVSKYTEGVNVKALRPNGLPKSLIRYDGNLYHLIWFYNVLETFHLCYFLYFSSSKGGGFRINHGGGPDCQASTIPYAVCKAGGGIQP